MFQLVIADQDEKYITLLTTLINKEEKNSFIVRGFSKKSLLKSYLQEQSVDILLISPKFYDEELKKLQLKNVMLLSEGTIPNELSTFSVVFKYQSTEQIIKDVIRFFSEKSQEHLIISNKKQVNIIGVYSPIGRSGKTSISIILSAVLARYKKVLYLYLEPYDNLLYFVGKNTSQYGLSDLLYYVKQKHPNLGLKIQGMKESFLGFDYILPIKCYADLLETSIEDYMYLLNSIKNDTCYDTIVINFNNNMVKDIIEQLNLCDNILTLIQPEKSTVLQFNSWQNNIKLLQKEKILDKMVFVSNQCLPTNDLKDINFNFQHKINSTVDTKQDYDSPIHVKYELPYNERIVDEGIEAALYDDSFLRIINQIIQELIINV